MPAGWANSLEVVDWVGIEGFGDDSLESDSKGIRICPPASVWSLLGRSLLGRSLRASVARGVGLDLADERWGHLS